MSDFQVILTRLLTVVFGLSLIAEGLLSYSEGGLAQLITRSLIGSPMIFSVLSSRGFKTALLFSVSAFAFFFIRFAQLNGYFLDGSFTCHPTAAQAVASAILALMNWSLIRARGVKSD